MELVQVYEDYKKLHTKLQTYLEAFINEEELKDKERFKETLTSVQTQVEELLHQATQVNETSENEQDIKDLNYLMTDTLFLMMDLKHFANHDEIGRCRMRMINYLGKRQRAQL